MPEAGLLLPLSYAPLAHINAEAVEAEIAKGSDGLLQRVFDLLMAKAERRSPAVYRKHLARQGQRLNGFCPEAYFRSPCVRWGGFAFARYVEQRGGLRCATRRPSRTDMFPCLRGHKV